MKINDWFLVPAAVRAPAPAGKDRGKESDGGGKEPKTQLISEKNNEVGEGEPNKPLTFELQKIDHAHPYLAERGITKETARTFGVGYFPGKGSMHGRFVVPIHNQN